MPTLGYTASTHGDMTRVRLPPRRFRVALSKRAVPKADLQLAPVRSILVSSMNDSEHDEWTDPPQLLIRAFGTGLVRCEGRLLSMADWVYTKAREMLFYLACNTPRTKEQIGLALWPEASSGQLRDQFRVTLHHLRRALGRPDWILYVDGTYAFNRGLPYWLDVEAFELHLSLAQLALEGVEAQASLAADYLDRATSLYEGDFLDGAEAEWCLLTRQDLLRKHLQALMARGGLFFEAGDYVHAAEGYRRAIAKDGYLEAAHRGLMRCLARQGELSQALRHYNSLATLLQEELNAPPAPETVDLYERLCRGEPI
jgi:DNA-binding SARP family transcriptional activator